MNYKKVYNKIIENRLNNPLDGTEYGEKHHIIPRSLGGSDEPDNLVRLTAREHFICHALLSEMYEKETFEWYKMNHAIMMMKASSDEHGNNRYFNSRLYELKRKDFSKVMSESQSGRNNSQYGKVKSAEHLRKLRNTWIEKYPKPNKQKIRDLKRKIKKRLQYSFEYNFYNNLFLEFKASKCSSLRDFVRHGYYDKSHVSLTKNFIKYVKEYNPKPNKPYIPQ